MGAPRVVIVGAGIAGLAAAWRLRARGADVKVVERAERPGGRATSDAREGFAFDAGAHLLSARDGALLALVTEAGLAEPLLPLRPVAPAQLWRGRVEPVAAARFGGVPQPPGLRGLDRLRLARLGRLRRRFAAILDPDAPERGVRLDDRSVADFTRLYFGRRVLELFAAPLLESAVLADPAQASRLLMLLWLEQRGHAAEGTLRGGLAVLAEALAAGVETRLGNPVERVTAGADGGFDIEIATAEGASRVAADAVVVATRAAAARRICEPLLVAAERDYLAGVRYAPAIVLHVALERPLTQVPTRLRVPAEEGGCVAAVLLEPAGAAGRAPGDRASASVLARADFSASRLEAPDEAVEKELLAALDRLVPGASRGVLFTHLRRHRDAWPRCDVGRFRAMQRFRRVVADRLGAGRRLGFAGDHLALPTLEGAVRSGWRAADDLAAELGLRPAW